MKSASCCRLAWWSRSKKIRLLGNTHRCTWYKPKWQLTIIWDGTNWIKFQHNPQNTQFVKKSDCRIMWQQSLNGDEGHIHILNDSKTLSGEISCQIVQQRPTTTWPVFLQTTVCMERLFNSERSDLLHLLMKEGKSNLHTFKIIRLILSKRLLKHTWTFYKFCRADVITFWTDIVKESDLSEWPLFPFVWISVGSIHRIRTVSRKHGSVGLKHQLPLAGRFSVPRSLVSDSRESFIRVFCRRQSNSWLSLIYAFTIEFWHLAFV